MAIEGTEERESTYSAPDRRRTTRRFAYVAAGLLALSTVGYQQVVDAPNSTAAEPSKCTDGEGSVTIKKKGSDLIGTAELTKNFKNYEKNEDCVGEGANGTSGPITATASEDGKSCELTAEVDKANGQAKEGDEFAKAGDIKVTVPLDGKPATATAEGTNDNGEKVTATATIKGFTMKECKTSSIPTDKFTATKVNATIEKADS
ncbi:hypothetical protein [Nocardia sp. XZ_19_369]|uniref:hypothetical protein n=1 Tax=Nocardia sp. XZ_19_369 TaxID=2769487 RepID=UPI00188F0CB1|nr:hypothetical protein [Nocardia sp. XZ_19_369]